MSFSATTESSEPAEPAEVAKIKTAAVTPIKSTFVAPVRTPTDHLPVLDLDDLPRNTFWLTLGRAVTLCREYGSATEAAYVGWLVNRLPVSLIDAAGNVHVDMRTDPTHRTMFTSHTDTVHYSGGINKVHVDGKFWRASLDSALGADDGAGNAIMAFMIEAGVPGYYVFFRGEECGGVGSKWLSKEMPDLFSDLDRAVAFDRAGYADVITHQSGGRCCSDEFAQELATALSTDTDWYMPCNGGVYTDTAEFTHLIAECTNISVGYKNQHGDREEQDVEFLWDLAQRCIQVQWDKLVVKRDPKAFDSKYVGRRGHYDWLHEFDEDEAVIAAARGMTSLNDDIGTEDLDEPELQAIEYIEDALYNNDFTDLIDLIAETVSPESPGIVTGTLSPWRLTEELLIAAIESLETGWSNEFVLTRLYDAATHD